MWKQRATGIHDHFGDLRGVVVQPRKWREAVCSAGECSAIAAEWNAAQKDVAAVVSAERAAEGSGLVGHYVEADTALRRAQGDRKRTVRDPVALVIVISARPE